MPGANPFDAARLRLFRLTWWQSALLIALVVAVVIAVALVATSLVLILAPVVLIAVLAHRLLGSRGPRRDGTHPGSQPKIIEAEYKIISPERSEDQRGRPD